jgi:hypothetical protein
LPLTPRVTVGIPVFRGVGLVEDALQSLAAQTFKDFEAVISVDGNDAASAARCVRYQRDGRFRVFMQEKQLGFANNLNWLAQRCETEFFVYLGQDDRLDTNYIAQLLAAADRHPEALVIYCDMAWFGALPSIGFEPELPGTAFQRVSVQLRRRHWMALRGLRRVKPMKAVAPLVADSPDLVLEDIIWFTEVMRAGTARRVPQPLYLKRRHTRSISNRQQSWPTERTRRAWLHAWSHMLRAALPTATTPQEARRLLAIALRSMALEADGQRWFIDIGALSDQERLALVSDFVAYLQRLAVDLPAAVQKSWPAILETSRRFVSKAGSST